LALAKILAAWLICFEKSMVALLSLLAYTFFSKASAASDLRTGIDLIAIAITYKLLVTKIMTSIDNYNKLYAKKREPSSSLGSRPTGDTPSKYLKRQLFRCDQRHALVDLALVVVCRIPILVCS